MYFVKVMTAGALLSSLGMVTSGFGVTAQMEMRENPLSSPNNQSIMLLKQLPFRIRSEVTTSPKIQKEVEKMTYYRTNYYVISQHIASRFPTEPLLQGKKSTTNKKSTVTIATIEELELENAQTKTYTPSFTNPVTDAAYTSKYGMRHGKHHNGVDIVSMSKNLDIRAAKTGVVVASQFQSNGLGSLVILDHGNGLESYYAHLSKRLVKEGDIVRAGDVIGKMGRTGHATGVHLHFEIRKHNKPINPIKYIN